MTAYGQGDFLAAARGLRQELSADLDRLSNLERVHETRRGEAAAERDATLGELARRIVPELTPAALTLAADLTGLARLATEPIPAMEAERTELASRLAEIEADRRWTDRERLRAPETGELTRRLAVLQAEASAASSPPPTTSVTSRSTSSAPGRGRGRSRSRQVVPSSARSAPAVRRAPPK